MFEDLEIVQRLLNTHGDQCLILGACNDRGWRTRRKDYRRLQKQLDTLLHHFTNEITKHHQRILRKPTRLFRAHVGDRQLLNEGKQTLVGEGMHLKRNLMLAYVSKQRHRHTSKGTRIDETMFKLLRRINDLQPVEIDHLAVHTLTANVIRQTTDESQYKYDGMEGREGNETEQPYLSLSLIRYCGGKRQLRF